MPVVQEDSGHAGLIWVQCPECKEIKPLDAKVRESGTKSRSAVAAAGAERSERVSPPLPAAARRVVRHYRAGERFACGEWIYHPGWDDTGEVIETMRSRGGHEIIVVAFQKCGTRRLVNNFAR